MMNQVNLDIPTAAPSQAVKADLNRLRETIGKVVGSVFYGTLLRTMRNSAIKGPFGHGGRGEEVFSGQLHGLFAEQMGVAERRGLPEAIFKMLERQQRVISERSSMAG